LKKSQNRRDNRRAKQPSEDQTFDAIRDESAQTCAVKTESFLNRKSRVRVKGRDSKELARANIPTKSRPLTIGWKPTL